MWPVHAFYYTWVVALLFVASFTLFIYNYNKNGEGAVLVRATFFALTVPFLLVVLSIVSAVYDFGLDSQSIYDRHESPREFFIALDQAELPYELVFLLAMVFQVGTTFVLADRFHRYQLYVCLVGFSGFYFSLLLGINLLNLWLGNWPRT